MDPTHVMSATAASGHQMLAVAVVSFFVIISFVSSNSGEKDVSDRIAQRAIGMLRTSARCSVRAERSSNVIDSYGDALKARIYVEAVERIVPATTVSRLSGLSIDEMRSHVDVKLSEARGDLEDAMVKCKPKEPVGSTNQKVTINPQRQTARWEAAPRRMR